jgi:hypothetical protein
VPIEVVQMILGHASPEVTRKVYAHVMRKITAAQVENATQLLTQHRPRSLGNGQVAATNEAASSGSTPAVSNPFSESSRCGVRVIAGCRWVG